MSYLLRVALPDRPGALGLLALALGEAGGDILSVDVVERGRGTAVDDLVIELPTGALPDVLITAAEALDGTRVDAVRPFTGVLDAHRELELIDTVAAAPGRGLRALVDAAPTALQVHWAAVVDGDGPAPVEASSGTPETWPETAIAPLFPAPQAVDAESDGSAGDAGDAAAWVPDAWRRHDIALAAAPIGQDGPVLLVGRNGGPNFRPAEVARLGYVAGILATVLR